MNNVGKPSHQQQKKDPFQKWPHCVIAGSKGSNWKGIIYASCPPLPASSLSTLFGLHIKEGCQVNKAMVWQGFGHLWLTKPFNQQGVEWGCSHACNLQKTNWVIRENRTLLEASDGTV